MTDAEVEQLRDSVHNLADIAVKIAKDAANQKRAWNPATLEWELRPDRVRSGR